MSSVFDTPRLPRLVELLHDLARGHLLIPDTKEITPWEGEATLLLLDSVWRGFPMGTLLTWHTHSLDVPPATTSFAQIPFVAPREHAGRNYLVDGRQRLLTLFAALWHDKWDVRSDIKYYVDLTAPASESPFRIPPTSRDWPPEWMPLFCLFDEDHLLRQRQRLVAVGERRLIQATRRLEARMRDYSIPMLTMPVINRAEVDDVVARLHRPAPSLTTK